jgi:CHAT domain-containing protein
VPHDLLFHLPFHALHDGQRYLLERFEVVYLPVASLLGRQSGQRPRRALIVGHDHDGRLPAALKEAQTIYEILAAVADKTGIVPHLLLSEDATEARLRQHAADCGVLHLATHGVFRQDNPLFSALRLADNWLTLADVERLALPQAPLVTLSACETGLGDLRRGDIFGLSQAFMQAGAVSLVVSLWPVPDEATRQLMIHFYHDLVAGKSKAAALRSAQLTLRSDPAYGHPLHWAGFVLVGDGGVLW